MIPAPHLHAGFTDAAARHCQLPFHPQPCTKASGLQKEVLGQLQGLFHAVAANCAPLSWTMSSFSYWLLSLHKTLARVASGTCCCMDHYSMV